MQHPYQSTYGPSRPSSRRSPTNLDSAEFSAGAAQPQGWTYGPTHISTTTATMNEYHQSAMQDGYPYYPQSAASSYYTQMLTSSTNYQNYNSYPTNTQSYQQTGTSYQSTPTADWNSSSYYDPLARPSNSYTTESAPQHAVAASSSTSQAVPSANPASPEKRTKAPKPTASTARRPKDSNPDMNSKMGRWRLGKDAPAQAPSQLFAVGELKRKVRASSPPDTTRETETVTKKKAKSAERSRNGRAELSEDIAKLTDRLPLHLRYYKDKPSNKNVANAVIYIDEQNARIGRLEDEVSRSHSEADQLKATQARHEVEIFDLRIRNQALRNENEVQRDRLTEKDGRIRELEGRQSWQYPNP